MPRSRNLRFAECLEFCTDAKELKFADCRLIVAGISQSPVGQSGHMMGWSLFDFGQQEGQLSAS
jgi:hypothetical protein